jgi:hypothetical protein
MTFEDKNIEIVLNPTDNINEKVVFVQNLYNKAAEKINHFDKLRQQQINYALLVFSGLLAFIIQTKNLRMQYVGCAGIAVLMLIFCFLDHRLHKYTHGLASSMLIFTQVKAYLLNEPKQV